MGHLHYDHTDTDFQQRTILDLRIDKWNLDFGSTIDVISDSERSCTMERLSSVLILPVLEKTKEEICKVKYDLILNFNQSPL